MRVCSLAVLAAAASLASLAAADGLPSTEWPRRALLQAQNGNGRQGFDIKHLMVFAGLMVALAVSVVVIGCLCVRYRQWLPNDGIMRPPPGIFRRRQPEVILQDAKPRALPIIVVMPDNCISYAHKLLPEEEEEKIAAAKAGSCRGSTDSSRDAGSGSGRSHTIDATASDMQLAELPAASASQATAATRNAVLQAAAVQAAAAAPLAQRAAAAESIAQSAGTTAFHGDSRQQRPADAAAGSPSSPQAAADAVAAPPPPPQQLGRRTYATGWVGRNWTAASADGTPNARILPPPQTRVPQQPQREPEVRFVPAFIECDGETVHYVPEPEAACAAASDASVAGGSSNDVSAHGGSANEVAATASGSLVGRLLRRSSRQPHAAGAVASEGQQQADRHGYRSSHRRSASRDSMNTGYFNRVLFDQ